MAEVVEQINPNFEKCKENGKLRIEGKDYIVKDGDVLYFRVNP